MLLQPQRLLEHRQTAIYTTTSSFVSQKRPAPTQTPAFAPPAKKPHTNPYVAFCREQRPFLPTSLRNGERERTLGTWWKALSDAERARYVTFTKPAPAPGPAPAPPPSSGYRWSSAPAPAPAPASWLNYYYHSLALARRQLEAHTSSWRDAQANPALSPTSVLAPLPTPPLAPRTVAFATAAPAAPSPLAPLAPPASCAPSVASPALSTAPPTPSVPLTRCGLELLAQTAALQRS